MTECEFRKIPEPRTPEDEMSAEPWYPVGPADVFPEEFGTFLLGNDAVRKSFTRHHAELLSERFWNQTKSRIAAGHVEDVFPYPESNRFRNKTGRAAARPG
jgi:isocitrate dehydrogenase kinase/phosphatase